MKKFFSPKSEIRGLKSARIIKRMVCYGLLTIGCGLATANAQAPTISYSGGPYTFRVGSPIQALTPTLGGSSPATNGQTITLAGSGTAGHVDGSGIAAQFNHPSGVAHDALGNIYIGDAWNNCIRKITPAGVVTTLAGSGTAGYADGNGTSAQFNLPYGLAVDASGNIYVADYGNNRIRKVTPSGTVSTLAGSGTAAYADGAGTAASFNHPSGLAVDGSGNLFVADCSNNMIREVSITGIVTTVAGSTTAGSADGSGTAAQFNHPFGLTFDPSGNLFVADWYNFTIRKITNGSQVTTFAGSALISGSTDGNGTSARFYYPSSITSDGSGNLYVTDEYNNKVRMITPSAIVTTLSGTGTQGAANGIGGSATFYQPLAITVDQTGYLYIAEYSNCLVRKVAMAPFTINQTLPPGLNFNPSSGVISGTPSAAVSATSYSASAYNALGMGSTSLGMTINPAPAGSLGQSLNQNYIMTQTPRISGLLTDSALAANSSSRSSVQVAVQYVDGLGRPIQTVQAGASPAGYDIVAPQAYDQYGREVTKYLPYTPQSGTSGSYKANAVNADQSAFYAAPPSGVTAITNPYSQTAFDNSPLNRPVEQGAPGVPWQLSTVSAGGHTVKMVYTLNNSTAFTTDSVNGRQAAMYYCIINSDNSRTLTANGYYPANTLTVTIAKDENWVSGRAGTVEEYKDIDGQVVLKRQYNYVSNAVQVLSTYYIYDDLGHLAFVLPPASGADGAGTISQTTLNDLCYQYQYDERGRPIAKKVPGKGWEYTVYNTMDLPVATQDANQQTNNQWIFTKYDALNRPIWSGIWNNGGTNGTPISRASLQTTLNGISTNLYETTSTSGNGYTNVAWPTTNVTATLTLDYYDGYSVPNLPSIYNLSSGVSKLTRGLATVKKTSVLNTPTDQLWDVMYYDDLGRATKTYSQHYLGAVVDTGNYDLTTTTYNFPNQPTTVKRAHWNTVSRTHPLISVFNKFIYDQVGRKLKTWEQITNGASSVDTNRLVSRIDYNEIGQVMNKHLHSKDSVNFLQNIAYIYNERGWLISSSAPLFAMQLYYNTGASGQAYNGNISYQYWGTPGNLTNTYQYTYDKLNRLLSGVSNSNYNESNITYDVMGNITTLNRYTAGTLTDQLSYSYNSTNQVQSITDNSGSNTGLPNLTTNYTYDGNGNLYTQTNTSNPGQNKTFNAYNLLDLPQTVTTQTSTLTYTYDATGQKLRRKSTGTNNTTDYIAGIQYDGATTPAFSFIQTEEGKAVPNGASYDYVYYLGDNLGNTRVTFGTKTGSAVSYQTDDYYPFGMEIATSISSPKNEYLYNKKELQEETQEYDYGARFYDPVIARWTTIDPLAEESRRWTPYNYVENDPIRLTDPDGMEAEDGNCCDLFDRIVRPNTDGDRARNPTKAAIHDFAYNALDFLGVKDLINAIGHLSDKNMPVDQKAAGVVGAVLNGGSIDGEGEHLGGGEFDKSLIGRSGKQERLQQLMNDDKLGSADRGWLKQEKKQVDAGKRTNMRNPPGKDLAHRRGRESAKGYSYEHSDLKNRADHKLQHKFDNNGKKNKERPN